LDNETLNSLTKVLMELQQSVEKLNHSVQFHQQRVEGLAASQVILFQVLMRHTGVDPADIVPELEQYIAKTPSESVRHQLQFHLKACEQTAEILHADGPKSN
jgi:hypothetical protein